MLSKHPRDSVVVAAAGDEDDFLLLRRRSVAPRLNSASPDSCWSSSRPSNDFPRRTPAPRGAFPVAVKSLSEIGHVRGCAFTYKMEYSRYCHPPTGWRRGCDSGTAYGLAQSSLYLASQGFSSCLLGHRCLRPRGHRAVATGVDRQSRSVDGAGQEALGGRHALCSGRRCLLGSWHPAAGASDWSTTQSTGTGVRAIVAGAPSEEDAVLDGPW